MILVIIDNFFSIYSKTSNKWFIEICHIFDISMNFFAYVKSPNTKNLTYEKLKELNLGRI